MRDSLSTFGPIPQRDDQRHPGRRPEQLPSQKESMEMRKLVTLAFTRNVGSGDRLFRLVSGAALTGIGWYLGAAPWIAVALSVFGLMWTATGVLARCSVYYALGYSSCPSGGSPPL
jgi:hypothetical protein